MDLMAKLDKTGSSIDQIREFQLHLISEKSIRYRSLSYDCGERLIV